MATLSSRRGTIIAGIAGVLWPVLAIIRVPLTRVIDQPSWTAERTAIVDFYEDIDFDAAFVVGIFSVTVAFLLFLVFIAKVAELLGDTDGGSRWLGYLIVGGAAMDTALVFAYLAPFATAVFWAGNGGLSADSYLVLHGLSFSFLWMELLAITVWMVPVGVGMVRTRLYPTWLGWLFLANSAAFLVAFFLPYAAWAVIGGLPYIWVLIAAVVMLARLDRFSASDHAVTATTG